MKHQTHLKSYRSARNFDGYTQSWQISTVTGNLGLWRMHHHDPTKTERFAQIWGRMKRSFLLAFSPETLVREQLMTANSKRLRVRP